ncbi:MAG: amidophosphoribosyltransferase [Thermotogota bacterium]
MCGILGIWGRSEVAADLIFGLTTLQHRGQDAAGAITFDGSFHVKIGRGLVSRVFEDRHQERLRGTWGLGHVRYATMGSTDVEDAQPVHVNYPYGLAMVHNGNVVNFAEVRENLYTEHHRLVDTSNDVALILYTFAAALEQRDLRVLTVDDLFSCVDATRRAIHGAYAVICLIAGRGLLAFSDPHGIRPMVLGVRQTPKGPEYAIASETTCLDYLGFRLEGDIGAGEAVFIDAAGTVHRHQGPREKPAFCVFEYIYFAREDSVLQGRVVAAEREHMGRALADVVRRTGLRPDVVIDVPASGFLFASSMAQALGIPFRRGLAKNHHIGRSFILPTDEERRRMVGLKLNPIRGVLEGRRVAVVDDSIVRGTTSRRLVELLRGAGAREVYVISAAPPVVSPCVYGIDMSTTGEIIAANRTVDDVCRMIGADAVIYQELSALRSLYGEVSCCDACFSGEYPTSVDREALDGIRREKEGAGR